MKDDNKLWSDYIPADILGLISSRLVGGEYFAFRSVCKRWRFATPPLHQHHHHPPLSSPCLMTLHEKTCIVEFFHPVYNVVTTRNNTGIHKLKGSRIRSSKASWLLMSHGNRGMFFFNPISNVIIELPDLPNRLDDEGYENTCCAWTFSCPPDSLSSDCFVVGFDIVGCPPNVHMIKVGETRWTYHDFTDEERGNSQWIGCNNPIFFNNVVYVLGEKGSLGTLSIKENSSTEEPTWKFHRSHLRRRKQRLIRHVYTAEDADNEAMIAVFLMHGEGEVEVWRYKNNGRERITSLDNKTLFVSYGGCYLKPCVAQGLKNKIYFPMFHDDNNGVFYCLTTRKYYSFDYSVIKVYSSPNIFNLAQLRFSIWIEPENN